MIKLEKSIKKMIFYVLGIGLIAFLTFLPSLNNEFINWDDGTYIFQNPYIQHLTWPNLKKIIGIYHYWMPVTWLTHALDVHWFGLKPAGHHLTSIGIHALNSILVFLLLLRLYRWKNPQASVSSLTLLLCAFVSVVWAVHPLRVESVVWASQKKDLLAGFFMLLTYMWYVKVAQAETSSEKWRPYAVTFLFFILAVASKPSAIMVPCVLFLIDWFGQRRLTVWDKIPFFVISGIIAFTTILGQHHVKAFIPLTTISGTDRIFNALLSWVFYIEKTVFPYPLHLYYPPFHSTFTDVRPWLSLVFLVIMLGSGMYLFKRFQQRLVLAGILSYMIHVVPVLGLFMVGNQVVANRWSYLSTVSLYYIAAGILTRFIPCLRRDFLLIAGACGIFVLGLLFSLTVQQIRYWKTPVTFWKQVIKTTRSPQFFAYHNLGWAYENKHDIINAISAYEKAISLAPNRGAFSYLNLGHIYKDRGYLTPARDYYEKSLQLQPKLVEAYIGLSQSYMMEENYREAISILKTAIESYPSKKYLYLLLGYAFYKIEAREEAISILEKALPSADPDVYYLLGLMMKEKSNWKAAREYFLKVKALDPDYQNIDEHLK